ncbi:MAG: stage II sporulation protein M [Candidatus Woesearchaeota archaeon]|nr:stage II sporulation protein M [Candidatus Woesearchaeota archaeon]
MLEELYSLEFIEKHSIIAFVMGLAYSVIGIGAALILFPEDPAIVAVAFTAIMIVPTLRKLLKREEETESKKEGFSLFGFFFDHKTIFKVYVFLFLGILLSFSIFALVLPSLATNYIFKNQIDVLYGATTGGAVFSSGLFKSIFFNNLGVLILCFIAAFIFGDGAIFLLVWNASVWGTIFGNLAKTAALNVGQNPFIYFIIVFVVVFPHMILEAFSYFCSASAGGIISKAIIKESFFSEKFLRIIKNTLILFVFAAIVLVIAVTIETYVLGNVEVYKIIIQRSFL